MGPGGWVVGVFLRFQSNGAATMTRLASTTSAANTQLARQTGQIDKNAFAMANYKRKIEEVKLAQQRLGTAGAGIAFAIGAAAMVYGVNQAAKLERAMTGVQIATGATADQYTRLKGLVMSVSGYTAQSAVTIANEMAAAAQVAFHDPKQLQSLFPMMAKYADVRYMSPTHDDPVQSIERMSQIAHFFGAYTPEKMGPLLDDTARLQYTTRATLQQIVTQGKYFIPIATQMGVSRDTIFQYLAIMGQLGALSGRGGTSVKNLILGAESVTPTAHMSQAKFDALNDLKLRDKGGTFKYLTKDGNLDLVSLVDWLRGMQDVFKASNPRTAKGRLQTDVGAIWGQAAAPLIAALVAASTKEQMNRNKTAFTKIPGVQGQWTLYSKDLFYQWNAFITNIANLATVIATPFLPGLTKFFGDMATTIGGWVSFLANHQDVAKTIGSVIAGLTALAGLRFAIGTAQLLIAAATALGVLAPAAPGIGLAARGLMLLDGVFLAGMGGRVVAIATKFGVLSAATNAMATVMGGSAVAGITGAFAAVQGALLGFAAFMVSPAILALLATLGLVAVTAKSAGNASEGNVGLFGHSPKFWLDEANKGFNVPREVRAILEKSGYHLPGAKGPVSGHPNAQHGKAGASGGHTTIGTVHITLPNVKTAKDAHEIAAALSDPRSMMGTSPATARTHPSIPMVLSVRTA